MKKYLLPLILILLFSVITIGYCTDYGSRLPPEQSDTYVKSTTKRDTNYWAYYATNPLRTKVGGYWWYGAWLSASSSVTNQRFHIDLGDAKIIKRIYYENYHSSGGDTDNGVQNFTFWGSNTGAGTFDDLVYANDEGWMQLTISQNTFDQHVAANQADPKYITVTNTTAYKYYAFKFADNYGDATYMGVRRIELQVETELEILRPNAAGDETAIPNQYPDSTFHWDKIDEAVTDENDTYVWSYATVQRDLYDLPASSGEGEINCIRIYFRAYNSGGSDPDNARATLKIDDTVVDGDWVPYLPQDIYDTFFQQWNVNPVDEEAWEWTDIDTLQIGISLKYTVQGTPRCTQVYVEVDYALPVAEVNVIFFSTPF